MNNIKYIMSFDAYIEKNKELMKKKTIYDYSYTVYEKVNKKKNTQIQEELEGCIG